MDTSYGLFTSPQYLEPLESSGCASRATGWRPAHLDLGGQRRLPCYEKSHSWGEFVFDFEIAQAYAARGLEYYPKLVSCVPFTPVPGPRLLAADAGGQRALAQALRDRASDGGHSGAHLLFLPPAEAALLEPLGWLRRDQLRYLWRNRGYTGFEDFLGRLSAKKRKNIRRERRLLAESGLAVHWRAGSELSDAEWPQVFELYASTYRVRGQQPYLNLACLRQWAEHFGERMQFCLAHEAGRLAAMAFFFRDGDTLYGRHWGAGAAYDALHFELCYYRGIDYCIEHRLALFDAGVQGEHKQARGFDAELSHSAHWFAAPDLHQIIGRFLARERAALAGHLQELSAHSAYRNAQ